MKKYHKALYFANTEIELITETGKKQFEKQGWQVDGNWLNSQALSDIHKIVLMAPAPFDNGLIVQPRNCKQFVIYAHLLYPDQLVGWNFESKKYLYKVDPSFTELLSSTPLLSHSDFTLCLVVETYGNSIYETRTTTYLPIEFSEIRKEAQGVRNGSRPLRVLWNHMWRSDKGFYEALHIIDQLSKNYPMVEFHIGRDSKWGAGPDVPLVQAQAASLLADLRARDNVLFHRQIEMAQDYWRFICGFDIGFSVSFHEGFGLSMLEQAAAGIACVVPDREAYPEIHKGALVTKNVTEGISELIEDSSKRSEIAQSCTENAKRFNAEQWAKSILQRITS